MSSTNNQSIFTSSINELNNKNHEFLSDYNIIGTIGRGTFSIVKLGENKWTKEKVAIKIMQKNKIINQEDLIRIYREIEILKSLKHPNVIKIYKILEDSKKFYIIMEYCENGELFNYIVEKHRLKEDEAAIFYYQLINGLEYIHKNKIVHRDLKPENLLITKDYILKIIDFGLSNYSKYNILLGTPCGSPCYASPEMVSGQKYNGFLIDIWSSGIILFAMICGYLPFQDNNNEILFGKILKCKINYPKYISELALDLLKKIIVSEPSKRITLKQIKEHPFYLRGKMLFNQMHPDIYNNNNFPEIYINNINLSNSGKIKSEENLVNNILNNNIKNYENKKMIYNPYSPENINYNYNIEFIGDNYNNIKSYDYYNNNNDKIIRKHNKNDIINFNPYNYDFYKINKNIYIKDNKSDNLSLNLKSSDFINNSNNNKKFIIENFYNKKENTDENIPQNNKSNNKNRLQSNSNSLSYEKTPRDSIPKNNKKDINNKNISSLNNMEVKVEDKYKRLEEISSMNSTGIQSIQKNKYSHIYDSYDLSGKSPRPTIKLGENLIINGYRKNGAETKSPENNIKTIKNIPIGNNTNINNKIKEQIIIEYFPKEEKIKNNNYEQRTILKRQQNLSYYNLDNNSSNKYRYSIITHQMPKNSYNNEQTNSILSLNEIKSNFLSNSVPKNNDKTNSYIKNKYPHNNHNKINNTSIKKNNGQFQHYKYNDSNMTNLKGDNNIETNIIMTNNNSKNNRLKNRTNKYVMKDNQNNEIINNEKNNKKTFYIFNNLKSVQKKEKIMTEHKNNEKMINSNKINYLYENCNNNSLSIGKKTAITPQREPNILNKNIFTINPIKKNKAIENTFNFDNFEYKTNTEVIINDNIININSDTIDNNKLFLSHNSPLFYEEVNNAYFNSIASNKNSINLNESKYYIYDENNAYNKKDNSENLKIIQNKNKLRRLFKEGKKNSYNSKNTKISKKSNNNAIEHTKKILNKRTNTNIPLIRDYKNKNKLISNNKNSGYHINKTVNLINNDNKKLIEKLKKKKLNIKKIYNLNDSSYKNDYSIKSNEIIFDIPNKTKEKNKKYFNNKSNHIIKNYYNNINNLTYTQNNTTKHGKVSIDNKNDDYIFRNTHNIMKTNINKNIWSYENKKSFNDENIFNNHYSIYTCSPKNLGEKNINIFNNNKIITKGKSLKSFDNIENKPKLHRIKKINSNINFDKEKYKNLVPRTHNTTSLESFGNFKKLNTIVTDSTHSTLANKNFENIRNYKKFVKQYYI